MFSASAFSHFFNGKNKECFILNSDLLLILSDTFFNKKMFPFYLFTLQKQIYKSKTKQKPKIQKIRIITPRQICCFGKFCPPDCLAFSAL